MASLSTSSATSTSPSDPSSSSAATCEGTARRHATWTRSTRTHRPRRWTTWSTRLASSVARIWSTEDHLQWQHQPPRPKASMRPRRRPRPPSRGPDRTTRRRSFRVGMSSTSIAFGVGLSASKAVLPGSSSASRHRRNTRLTDFWNLSYQSPASTRIGPGSSSNCRCRCCSCSCSASRRRRRSPGPDQPRAKPWTRSLRCRLSRNSIPGRGRRTSTSSRSCRGGPSTRTCRRSRRGSAGAERSSSRRRAYANADCLDVSSRGWFGPRQSSRALLSPGPSPSSVRRGRAVRSGSVDGARDNGELWRCGVWRVPYFG